MSGFLSKLNPRSHKPIAHKSASSNNHRQRDEHDPRIVYQVQPRARRINIKIDAANREAIISAPTFAQLPAAREFAREKADWINVHLEDMPLAQPFKNGAKIYYRGELTEIVSPHSRERPKYYPATRDDNGDILSPPRLFIPAPEDALEGRAKRFLIRQAREALEERTAYHARRLGKTVTKVTVRDTKSRWGSCAPNGHISYSWRLVCAPPFVLDYVAAHEVSHLIEPNHSQAFWDVVDTLVDTVKPAKKWLRQHGPKLHAVGKEF